MFSALLILFGVFFLGVFVGNRLTIAMLLSYVKEQDDKAARQRIKDLYGRKDDV